MKAGLKQSPVVSFMQSVWDNANAGKGHSWGILNQAMKNALNLAVTAHFHFEPQDFADIYRKFTGSYWFGTDADGKGMGGHFYSLAVAVSNMSACKSFEQWNGYEPYLWLGKRLAVGGYGWGDVGLVVIFPGWESLEPGSLTRFKTDERMREALANKYAHKWWVTGFDEDHIRLANYYGEDNQGGHRQGKPKNLKKLTRDELARMSKAIRAAMRPVKPKGKEAA